MTRKKKSDVSSAGPSKIVPYDPNESPQDRHRRRLEAGLSEQDTVASFCDFYKITFNVKNEGQHWMFILNQRWIEWWPSSGKFVVEKQWDRGTHVHDVEQVMILLKKKFNLRDENMFKEKFIEFDLNKDNKKTAKLAEWWIEGKEDSAKYLLELLKTTTNVESQDSLAHLLSELGKYSIDSIIENLQREDLTFDELEVMFRALRYNEYTEENTDKLKPILERYLIGEMIVNHPDLTGYAIEVIGQFYPEVAHNMLGLLFVGDKETGAILDEVLAEVRWKMRHD